MFDYDSLRVIWWLFLGLLLAGFAALDGIVLGLGSIFGFVDFAARGIWLA